MLYGNFASLHSDTTLFIERKECKARRNTVNKKDEQCPSSSFYLIKAFKLFLIASIVSND